MSRLRMVLVMMGVVGLMLLAGCRGDEVERTTESGTQPGEETVAFTGMVEIVEPLGQREAAAYRIGPDPRFLLVVKIDYVGQNEHSPVASGETIRFAIHSPIQLFLTEDVVGEEFRFTATWVFGPGRNKHFSHLRARPGIRANR